MKKIKFVTEICVLALISVGSAFICVSGVVSAMEALLKGETGMDILGPIAVTFIFSQLCAGAILKAVSKIERFEKNARR